MRRLIKSLKPNPPSPRLAGIDPFALRALVVLLVVSASIVAGNSSWQRIVSAFSFEAGVSAQRYRLHAWVTPPVYTGAPPIVLADGETSSGKDDQAKAARSVPEGSVVLVRVHGPPSSRPTIVFAGSASQKHLVLEPKQSDGKWPNSTWRWRLRAS